MARATAGLTVRELSERTGFSIGWLSGVETGDKLPSLQRTRELARACGMDPEAWAVQWRKATGRARATSSRARSANRESARTRRNAPDGFTYLATPNPSYQVAGERGDGQNQHGQPFTQSDHAGSLRSTAQGLINVAVVDAHPIILDTAAMWLESAGSDIQVIGTAQTVNALLAGPGRQADVVILDLDLPDGSTVADNVAAILATGSAVLIWSASDRPLAVRAAIHAGARGYVLKNEQADQVRSAIREVAAGGDWISPRLAYILATDDAVSRPALSPQETRALQLFATGLPMKSVARKMGISEETVKQYLARIRQKYALAGRASPTKLELYHRAVEDGHLPPTP